MPEFQQVVIMSCMFHLCKLQFAYTGVTFVKTLFLLLLFFNLESVLIGRKEIFGLGKKMQQSCFSYITLKTNYKRPTFCCASL